MQEPLEQYLEAFDVSRDAIDTLLESTVDLTTLLDKAVDVLADGGLLSAVRYLAGPPISEDDLKTLADDASLTPSRLRADPAMAQRIIEVILLGVDRQRFPWISENREPTEAERQAAVVATAALLAQRSVMTGRANESKDEQEKAVKDRLVQAGLTEVERRTVHNLSEAPPIGTFCAESLFGTRKADIVVRLYDGRVMPTEAKVSNSSTNSVKRLNNDAAVKARQWTQEFGTSNVVPSAVLAGVFKIHNLRSAQDGDNLTIFWAHNLDAMVAFIEATK
ncbi:MAG: XamI family restriction endonuclease [Acidimicrobiales bacterium]